MDKKTILIKTSRGESEVSGMSGDMKRVLLLIDGVSTYAEVIKHAPPSLRGDLSEILQQLIDSELVCDKSIAQPVSKIAMPKIVVPKNVAPKPASLSDDQEGEELDFTSIFSVPDRTVLAAEAEKLKAAQEVTEKKKAEQASQAKIEAEAARLKAEAQRLKAEQEAAAKAKTEAETRAREAADAARLQAELEAAKAKAEALAEERARQEAEAARIKAEADAARIKTEQAAAAKAKAEAEARAQQEAEVARLKAELEAAKAKAEAEAKALVEERARQEAEAARIKAEADAARIKAEQAAAAKAKAEAETRAQQEAEAARLKAELEAAKAKAEAEAKALAEERARQEAEAARIKAEAQRLEAEQEAVAKAKAEAEKRAREEAARGKSEEAAAATGGKADQKIPDPAGFEIDLTALSAMESRVAVDELSGAAQADAVERSPVVAERVKPQAPEAKQDIAAEMAKLKAGQEAARLQAEQEARVLAEEQALAAEQEIAWAEAEQRAEQQSKLDTAQAARDVALAQAKSRQRPAESHHRKPLPLGKITAGILLLAAIALFVLPMFWPMQEYIAPFEQRLTERFKQPVKVAGMSASLLPSPRVVLSDISVGAGELTTSSATLVFDPLSLLSGSKSIKDLLLQDVTVGGRHLADAGAWFAGMGGDPEFPISHVTVRNLKVVADEVAVPSLQGGADFEHGDFSRLVLHSEDEKLNVEIKVVENRTQISFGIRDSALPLLPAAIFGSFNARGEMSANEINISDLDALAYGGIWSGKGRLNWSRGWNLDASIKAKTMELSELFPQYGLAGEVFVDAELIAGSANLASLGRALRIDASFEAKRGSIDGVDMVETARLASHEHLVGGRTHFDELDGSFVAENGAVRFRSVRIDSGMLKAAGTFDVSADGQLSGSFDSEIKMRSGNNPLLLSGKLSELRLVAR
jgi:hypothetical protein